MRTIATKNMIPGMKIYRTKNTGSSFRVANGHFVPNEGEVKLMGTSSNGNGMCIKAQVADITRPLAATAEMVDAGNNVIIHKDGGVIKQVTQDQLERTMGAVSNEPGLEIPVYRKTNTFVIDVDIPDPKGDVEMGGGQGDQEGGFQKPKKTVRVNPKSAPMELDRVGLGEKPWAALWDEDSNCQPCGPAFHGRAR